ncbi:MAG TPA: sigma 54-interacting transcriptional regulator [Polyangiales bacterium]|nr:sigma 54-interacting transcriptional regulator [Polyangiales bacterium]
MPRRSPDDATHLLGRALSAALGPAMLLDSELRIALATDEVSELLGVAPRLGASAPQLLCGQSAKRPVAEALVEGRAIQAVIPHPDPAQAPRSLRVRSLPLTPGWLLLIDEVPSGATEPVAFEGMWTQSPRMKRMFEVVQRVASEDLTVLVRGETGTGKELVARALHNLSPRRKGPFRAINCAALPANLLESELFGHVRGAFTGAVRDTPGHVQLAHRGTLFLDEVAELPLELQAKLLRVLETRSVLPVGAREPAAVDVRFVSATHRALRKEVEANRFRADLMYRLRVVPIFLPALRERREDIALLANKLIESRNATARRKIERIAAPALRVLERYDWPGNIRELQNVIAYAGAIGEGPLLQLRDLPPELLEAAEPEPAAVPEAQLTDEGRRILEVLARVGGNKNKAAKVLGVSRVTLWRKLQAMQPNAHE